MRNNKNKRFCEFDKIYFTHKLIVAERKLFLNKKIKYFYSIVQFYF